MLFLLQLSGSHCHLVKEGLPLILLDLLLIQYSSYNWCKSNKLLISGQTTSSGEGHGQISQDSGWFRMGEQGLMPIPVQIRHHSAAQRFGKFSIFCVTKILAKYLNYFSQISARLQDHLNDVPIYFIVPNINTISLIGLFMYQSGSDDQVS